MISLLISMGVQVSLVSAYYGDVSYKLGSKHTRANGDSIYMGARIHVQRSQLQVSGTSGSRKCLVLYSENSGSLWYYSWFTLSLLGEALKSNGDLTTAYDNYIGLMSITSAFYFAGTTTLAPYNDWSSTYRYYDGLYRSSGQTYDDMADLVGWLPLKYPITAATVSVLKKMAGSSGSNLVQWDGVELTYWNDGAESRQSMEAAYRFGTYFNKYGRWKILIDFQINLADFQNPIAYYLTYTIFVVPEGSSTSNLCDPPPGGGGGPYSPNSG